MWENDFLAKTGMGKIYAILIFSAGLYWLKGSKVT